MIIPDRLVKGQVYYSVSLFEEKGIAPEIFTYFYIGDKNHDFCNPKDENRWFFQYSHSYLKDGSILEMSRKDKYDARNIGIWVDVQGMSSICELGNLVDAIKAIIEDMNNVK